ncbi:hypothetical protein PY365_04850 [Roseiarcaceae bacterium H3SJ34-1]|uniref:hypothetical protein n=1 Tax=Terripilifer ovatus TaxID=3032367 RepID=UPI003AB98C39|nr:hypothetical protein [Roseiarcaceae bacterium H3SJ34-1]
MAFFAPVPGIPGAATYRVESLPADIVGGDVLNDYIQAKPGELLFSIPGIARFRVRNGDTIEYWEEDGADPGLVQLYLHGTARGALIHQRGELPFHAATLVPPGQETALAICGPSGAGKSTLAAELVRRGWILVADDTTRVTSQDGQLLAWPSRDTIKLWKDACEAAQIEVSEADRVAKDMNKYYVRAPSTDWPVPLGSVVELIPDAGGAPLGVGAKLALLTRNTYRLAQIKPLAVELHHVRMVSQIATRCRIIQLPSKGLPVTELADLVENELGAASG